MEINDRLSPLPIGIAKQGAARKSPDDGASADIADQVSLSGGQEYVHGTERKVFGAIGAAIGATAVRLALLPGLGAMGAGSLAGSFFGPAGTVIGGIVGLVLGGYAESKLKAGKLAGGMTGGAVGSALGTVAETLGHRSSPVLAEETKGFSLKSLFKNLQDPKYSSHQKISLDEARKIIDKTRPGDIIITNNDDSFGFENLQKLLGKSGDWTHILLMSENKTSLEVLISADGAVEKDAAESLTSHHHVMILRPSYEDRAAVENTIGSAREYQGKVTYDHRFNLSSDDKHYCQEYVYKALQKGAPGISIPPSSLLGFKYITADDFIKSPDMKQEFSTGSNFWLNQLSKFD
jgi:hypothetical protein